MVGKRKVLVQIIVLVLVSLVVVACSPTSNTSTKVTTEGTQEIIKIGISQIAEHPALDAAREGFIAALESNGFKNGENVDIDFQNAQGDMPTAQTIAENFVSDGKDMILAIATPSAQTAYNVTKEIPIIITAVTDPVQSGLVDSLEKSGTNVTGTSDATPIKKQFELLKQLIPDAQRVGILYNTSESNSEIQVEKAKDIASNFNLDIITAGVTNVNEISQVLDSLLGKIDVLYIPTDNLVVSAMPLVIDKSMEKKIPVIGSEKGQVEAGALATEGIDYYNLGFQTGLIALEVIDGKNPEDMRVTTLEDTQLIINEASAKALQIDIPKEIKESAELVKGGE